MTDQIIPRSMIQAKARDAFARGVERDDHGFNWHCADAIATWQAAWDDCNGKLRHVLVEGTPP